MLEKIKAEHFNKFEELVDSNDNVGLFKFIDERMTDLIDTLCIVFSDGISLSRLQAIKEHFWSYVFEHKNCSLEELGNDLFMLIAMFGCIYNSEKSDKNNKGCEKVRDMLECDIPPIL